MTAVIPGTVPGGIGYRFRVIASDSAVASSAFRELLTLKIKATVQFATDAISYMPGVNPKVAILLTGDSPYSDVYGNDVARFQRYSSFSIDSLYFNAVAASSNYKLFSVSNVCGAGTIGVPSAVRLEVITAVEYPSGQMFVTLMPNPVIDYITLKFPGAGVRKASLFSIDGKLWLHKTRTQTEELIDFRNMPPGVFVLRVEFGSLTKNFKVIRQ